MNKTIFFVLVSFGLIACSSTDSTGPTGNADSEWKDKGTKKVETLVTCEESAGDQWKSVGIANDGPGLIAYVVQNNADDDSHYLLWKYPVSKRVDDPYTIYQSDEGSIRVTVLADPNVDVLTGEMSTLEPEGWTAVRQNLDCFANSSLEFVEDKSKMPKPPPLRGDGD
jgi:hypothetical protein